MYLAAWVPESILISASCSLRQFTEGHCSRWGLKAKSPNALPTAAVQKTEESGWTLHQDNNDNLLPNWQIKQHRHTEILTRFRQQSAWSQLLCVKRFNVPVCLCCLFCAECGHFLMVSVTCCSAAHSAVWNREGLYKEQIIFCCMHMCREQTDRGEQWLRT